MDNDALFFFGEHMDALPIYERLEERILTQIPDVKIKVAKTQITFANKRGFTCGVNAQAIGGPRTRTDDFCFVCGFGKMMHIKQCACRRPSAKG